MNTYTESASFFIEYNEKQYECLPMERNSRMIYQIKFPGSYIYLTEAKAETEKNSGHRSAGSKLNHIIPILGKQ